MIGLVSSNSFGFNTDIYLRLLLILVQGVLMGKKKKVEVGKKLAWAEWLIEGKKALAIQDDQPQDSNFIPHDHTTQGFAGISTPNPGVLSVRPKKQKKSK
jgi:hypothetical protein